MAMRWTDELIIERLRRVVETLGRTPRRADFEALDEITLYEAIRRRGGIREWTHRLEAVDGEASPPETLSPTAHVPRLSPDATPLPDVD